MTEMKTMAMRAMRTAVALTLFLGAACAPARAADGPVVAAAAPDPKTVPTPAVPAATATAAAPIASATPAAVVTPGATVAEAKAPIRAHKDRMRWIEGPPAVKGSRMTVLEGNPKQPGLFTIRLSVPAGSKVPLHTHPQDERVTLLEGKVTVVLGSDPAAKGEAFGPGDFYLNPAGMPHTVVFEDKSTVQITGMGPWEVTPASP